MKYSAAVLSLLILAVSASAAPGGGKGKPGNGDDGGNNCDPSAAFPVLAYPVDSEANDGTRNIVLASSDGCTEQVVASNRQMGTVRLFFDSTSGSGYIAWTENTFPGNAPGSVKRRSLVMVNDDLDYGVEETIYQSPNYLVSFDIVGDWLGIIDSDGSSNVLQLRAVDLSACAGGLPCEFADTVAVYDSGEPGCLSDASVVGCYNAEYGVSFTPSGDKIYFMVRGFNSNGGREDAIAVAENSSGWASATVSLFLTDDNYYEIGALGTDGSGRYLGVGYLAGFQNDGLRDDRVVIIDTLSTGPGCPCEAGGFAQDFSAWTAIWTRSDTMYVLGTAGKRRKMTHPIEEFDPATGNRTPIGIALKDHPQIDSSL